MASSSSHLIGVISDTHGLLRPEAVQVLTGCEQILHAGDIGKPEVLDELHKLAPTRAVRGNIDTGEWAAALPLSLLLEIEGQVIYVLHSLAELELNPAAAGIRVVVSGHSHQAFMEERAGVLYLNPGSAGPRRFGKPVTLARLRISQNKIEPELIDLPID